MKTKTNTIINLFILLILLLDGYIIKKINHFYTTLPQTSIKVNL